MRTPIKPGGVHMHYNDGAIHVDGSICGTSFHIKEKTPHWLKYGDGSAAIEMTGAIFGKGPIETKEKCWMQIDTSEVGEKSSKRTMITIGKDDVERLRDFCNVVLGDVEQQMLACWMDIARQRGMEAADREMLLNMNWKAPGSAS